MLAALSSWVLGTALALDPGAGERLDVTLVASEAHAAWVAQRLAPRLTEAGFEPEFRRCDDFSCATAPQPGDAPGVIVVVSERADDTLVIVTHDDPRGVVVVVDEVAVAVPQTTLDAEVLGFAVIRDLTELPLSLRGEWSVARREGLDRAPPPAPPVREATEPVADALPMGRGPYLELAGGSSFGPTGGMPMAFGGGIGAGWVVEAPRASRLRGTFGVRVLGHVQPGGGMEGLSFMEARAGLGVARPRVVALAHLGLGPGVAYGGRYSAPRVQGVWSLAGSLRGPVGERLMLGVEAGVLMNAPIFDVHVYGLFQATWVWQAKRRGRR